MSDVTFVDFRCGMVSERLRRRTDMSFYGNSASLIRNAVPLRTGGVVSREGLELYRNEDFSDVVRIIPVVRDDDNMFILAFTPKTEELDGVVYVIGKSLKSQILNPVYTAEEISSMSVAVTFDRVVIAQGNHMPQEIVFNSEGSTVSEMREFVPTPYYSVYNDGELTEDHSQGYTYKTMLNRDNPDWYPSGCMFVAGRLAFYGFKACPYGFILSHPFEYNDFTESVKYVRETSSMTSEKYLDALAQLQKTETETRNGYTYKGVTYSKVYIKRDTTVSTQGFYMTTVSIVDGETSNVIDTFIDTRKLASAVWNQETMKWTFTFDGDETVQSVQYFAKDVSGYIETVTDDCAIRLEIASDRDERICWLGQIGNSIYIGTTSSEWIMPSSVTALQVQCSKLSSYGSEKGIRCCYGMRNLFNVQRGGKKIRSIQYTEDGPVFSDMTYQCPELFSDGVRDIVWQSAPEPRMYALTNRRNEIAVLCYDADYSVNAWCIWSFRYGIKSICVLDNTVFVLTDSGLLCRFAEGLYSDVGTDRNSVPFSAEIVTNNIDSTETMALNKKTYTVYADTDGTGFSACVVGGDEDYEGRRMMNCRTVKRNMSRINTYTPFENGQGVRVAMKGNEGERFSLLALIVEAEVGR